MNSFKLRRISWLRLQSSRPQISFNVWSTSFDSLKAVEQSGGVGWNVFNEISVS
jgi:hypothetical protein